MIEGSQSLATIEVLEARLKAILPEEYQECYEDVEPVSMGSAGLQYQRDGKVAWDDIWGSFCDLAMAGGPPHKGTLLQPASKAEIDAQPDRYKQVAEEICRGIRMTAELAAEPFASPGWVRMQCGDRGSAEWLARAIVMENISARCDGTAVDLPAGPAYRIEKEIKNVVTSVAKTCHYYLDHMSPRQKRTIGKLFAEMAKEWPLLQPGSDGLVDRIRMKERILEMTGLRTAAQEYPGWLGVECPSVHAAVWMMRGLVVSNVLARREETTLFVAIDPANDPDGEIAVQALARVHGYAKERGVL